MKAECFTWTVEELISSYRRGDIIKPKIQRKQCWGETAADGTTNNAEFIQFISRVGNSINPIIFVKRAKLILLDGNNRLNALVSAGDAAPHKSIIPVVILNDITDEELIEVYEKINVTGVRLEHSDILAATASTVIYSAVDIPFFADIYPLMVEHYAKNSAREALPVALTDYTLNQYEILIGLGIYMKNKYCLFENIEYILGVCETIYGDLRAQIPIDDFIRKVDSACALITNWKLLGTWHKLTIAPQVITALVTGEKPSTVARAIIYTEILAHLPTRKAGAPNIIKLKYKQSAPFRGDKFDPPAPELLRELFNDVLNELNNPVECTSKKERRTPTRAYACLLWNYYEMYTPPAARSVVDVEHIIPYSTQWPRGIKLNIHRAGNLTLIPRETNLTRGNSHLTEEYLNSKGARYSGYPSEEIYCNIVDKRRLISADAYNNMCADREKKYIDAILSREW